MTPWTADAYIYTHTMEYYSAIRKNEILPFVRTWLDLEDITVNEISQTEKYKNARYHLHVESEKMKQRNLTETDSQI